GGGGARWGGVGYPETGAADGHSAAVVCDLAGEDADERGLPRSVLADERVDLSGKHVEVDAVESAHAGELHRDAAGLDEGSHALPRRRRVMSAAPGPRPK